MWLVLKIYFMPMSALPACIYVYYAHAWCSESEEGVGSLGLELCL